MLPRLFSSCGERGLLLVAVRELLWQRLLLLQSRELSALGSCRAWAQKPGFRVALGPCCSAARGILLAQGSDMCLLPRQAGSSPLSHLGSPEDLPKCLSAAYISSLKK